MEEEGKVTARAAKTQHFRAQADFLKNETLEATLSIVFQPLSARNMLAKAKENMMTVA